MIDFTKYLEVFNEYSGSEKKKTLVYENKKYLVKFPDPIREKNKNISYINNAFSEYLGSHIFELCGFDVQKTILGYYNYNNKEKIVCACLDFTDDNHILYEFENLALSTNTDKKIDTELIDIIEVIDNSSNLIDVIDTKKRFYEMFVIDFLIGNTDRHNGNWGFLVNKGLNEVKFAPIYDCGSSLNPLLEDSEIEKLDDTEIKNIALNTFSCLKENGKKIHYVTYLKSLSNKELNDAIKRVYDNINIESINKFIDNIECMSNIRKEFYKKIIKLRYDILTSIYDKL